MQWLRALLLFGFGTTALFSTGPDLVAAELAVTQSKKTTSRVIHRKRARIVLDYDGTPVLVHRTRYKKLLGDGTYVLKQRTDLTPVVGGLASYYINGEPVLPQYPRSYRY
jgi:hypothetical protein